MINMVVDDRAGISWSGRSNKQKLLGQTKPLPLFQDLTEKKIIKLI
jgi:hypothetical protein